jgi:hypothetical protein
MQGTCTLIFEVSKGLAMHLTKSSLSLVSCHMVSQVIFCKKARNCHCRLQEFSQGTQLVLADLVHEAHSHDGEPFLPPMLELDSWTYSMRTGCDPRWITFLRYCYIWFFCSVQKYCTLSTKLSIMPAKCTLVLKKAVFLPLKTKAKPNCTPSFLLPVTHPLCMVVCHQCLG